ncbi:galactose ABC transporter substrate-binding protein [Desulfosporosinus sp. FKA]|uniref:galactose ABC transporter substrate-binding protein n=1 Tax=Desulfosporosinus sp. FKA TaxID=1969834 RepID=UPI000B4A2EF5|nr:galactose ABC transporter substrate-binding protein [Desulfosporosinus sp. FKA]
MKATIKVGIILMLAVSLFVTGCSKGSLPIINATKKPVIGVVVATFDDTWRTSVRNELYKMGEKNNAEVDIWDSNNSQVTEDQKIDMLLKRKVDALVINLVDTKSATSIIEKAKKANTPVVFFNVEPSANDLSIWDRAYYVGALGEKSGTMQGQILVNYFKSHPTKNGLIRYVMIKGAADHLDAIARTIYSIKAIEDAGFKVEKVAEASAMWERGQAQQKMNAILAAQGDAFDCVIANNDDMALGAIDALKSKGYFVGGKYIPVVGVDAISSAAINALKEGTLLGTVLNDAVNQGKAIFNLAIVLTKKETPSNDNCGYQITNGKYIWIDYKVITKENINDAIKS